jgi:hypothetical protein
MRRLLLGLLLCLAANAQAGFNQQSYAATDRFDYGTTAATNVSVTVQLASGVGVRQLYTKLDRIPANEDSNQLLSVYANGSMSQNIYSQPLDLAPIADGTIHSVQLYLKIVSTNGTVPSKPGTFTFTVPLYVLEDSTENTATLTVTATISPICNFVQPVFAANVSGSVNQQVSAAVPITYKCAPTLSPSMYAVGDDHPSSENRSITMRVFADNGFSQNIAFAPTVLVADGSLQSKTIYVKYYEGGNPYISTSGTYNISVPLTISY